MGHAHDGHDAATISRRTFLRGAGASGLLVLAPRLSLPAWATPGPLRAGAARTDITPGNGGAFFGYVRPDMRAEGVAHRLHAHALVLDDGIRQLALVSVDLGAPMVKDEVVERVRHLGFDAESVLLAATHTHAGPTETDDWTAHQIATAVRLAHQRLTPARAGWGSVPVTDVNQSRSVEAHLANHGHDITPGLGHPRLDPLGEDHTRDVDLRLLRVEALDGTPIAAWTHFSVHPTTFIPANTLFSADFPAVANKRFERAFRGRAPVAMFTNGTEGDQITWFDDYNQFAVADRIGLRVAGAMARAWERAAGSLSRSIVVDARRATPTYEGQEVAPGERVAAYVGYFGASFFGGAKNGPSIFYETPGMEGRRRPAALADPVHGRKIIAAPAPWSPTVEVQVLRVGDAVMLGVPGEPSVEAGRRMRAAAREVAPHDVRDLFVVGLANGMHGYFTTPEEYDQQHYEGGHTVFGKFTSLLVQNTHVELTRALSEERDGGPPPSGDPPAEEEAPVGDGGVEGELTRPPTSVERMHTTTFSWRGGSEGRDRPVGEPFVVLERRDPGGWVVVDDDVRGWGMIWWEEDGLYTVRYEPARDQALGTHRFRVRSARYQFVTPHLQIRPATRLRVLGVELVGDRLRFVAQNPPPLPDTDLRTRAVRPRGGMLRFTHDGRERTARWDASVGRWSGPAAGARPGDAVTVPTGGLVDGLGNRSGNAVTLEVGVAADLDWPPAIGPAGGRTPGPFGVGGWPP